MYDIENDTTTFWGAVYTLKSTYHYFEQQTIRNKPNVLRISILRDVMTV